MLLTSLNMIRMQHVWELGFQAVRCFYDCAEVVEVVNGVHDVSRLWHSLVIQQAQELLNRSWSISVSHVPLERNKWRMS